MSDKVEIRAACVRKRRRAGIAVRHLLDATDGEQRFVSLVFPQGWLHLLRRTEVAV